MEQLNIGGRLWLAFTIPFRVFFDGSLAARVQLLTQGQELPALSAQGDKGLTTTASEEASAQREEPSGDVQREQPASSAVSEVVEQRDLTPALQVLAILQREGRFVDFLQEEMGSFSDEEIGAAARVVHEGCKRGLKEYLQLEPILREAEGQTVSLPAGYDARAIRVTGNVGGEPPYQGSLAHHGWRAKKMILPDVSAEHDAHVLAQAEVEL